jgi:bifunctional DNase/RNase
MNVDVEAVKVAGTPDGPAPVVLLAPEGDAGEVLPVFVGFEEAMSIARGTDAVGTGRPRTHDLLLDTVEELGGRVDSAVVRAVEEGTYLADLGLATPRGETTLDARPSDAIALAVRVNAPVRVAESVFSEGRRPRGEFEGMDDIREAVEG